MSRLDHHIGFVRNKLALSVFLAAWAWTGLFLAIVVLLAIICQRVLDRTLSHAAALFWIGIGLTAVIALIHGVIRRPSSKLAAIKIDQALGLKEKFSTALYVRSSNDPFAQAAVKDAERAAQNVSIDHRFPIQFPRHAITAAAVFLLAFLVAEFMPALHVFPKPPPANASLVKGPTPRHDSFIAPALPTIMAPAALPNASEKIRQAADELNKAVHTDEGDQLRNRRSVLSALQNYKDAMAQELNKNEKFQTVIDENNQMSAIASAKDDSTPIGKAQNDLKSGDLDAAMKDISKAVADFDKSKPEDQQKMIDQAKNLAEELAKAGNDPKAGQKIAQQLMQMGASQSQAQQMSAAMQQAAQGDPQAQQQLQQMAKQIAQQMNNGQGPTQQQQQQIQSLLTKSQSLANSQAQARALSNSAQQLAVAMSHAAQQSGSPGSQSKPGQGSQGRGNPSQQGMAGAQQSMQQQLQQMQAQAHDAQAMQAAANAAAQAAADAAAGLATPGAGNDAGDGGPGQGQGQNPKFAGGQNQGNGGGGLGHGGAKMGIVQTPYSSFKQEVDPSKDIATGRILASRYVKDGIDPGKSTAGLKDAAAAAEKDAPDEIDQDRIPREAQQAEKEYFSDLQKEDGQ